MLQSIKNHPSILHANDIKQICKPLHILDITAFSHLRIFNENQLTVQCNNPQFLLNYLNKQYYNADPCVNVRPESTDLGEYLIWDTIDCHGKTAEMLADSAAFDFKHVFTIIKKQDDYTDFYHFATHLSNPAVHQIYINNLDLLDRFITFFHCKTSASKSLSRAYDIVLNPVHIASNHLGNIDNPFITLKKKREWLLQALAPSSLKLTTNEITCAEMILKGQTAKEIGKHLGLSHRTIEDRINSLKIKLNAKNKAELIIKLFGIESSDC